MWKSGWGHVLVYATIVVVGFIAIDRYRTKKVAEERAAQLLKIGREAI
ncbi:MAG: hypothetical protein WCT13_06110 [Patescibacteria group bacterium]